MRNYTGIVEVEGDVDQLDVDDVARQLAPHDATIGTSDRGRLFALVNLSAESLQEASSTAAELVSTAFGLEAVHASIMVAEDFDNRDEWAGGMEPLVED